MNNQKNIYKALLAVLLLLCLLKMPYWYYQLIRILGMIAFIHFAYLDNKDKIRVTPQVFVIAAIIFNPIVKISFHKDIWQIIDVVFAIALFLSIFLENRLATFKNENGKIKIMLISVDEVLIRLLKEELEEQNFDVDYSLDWMGGVKAIRLKNYDLAILSIVFPGISVKDVLINIKKYNKSMPVIIMDTDSKYEYYETELKQYGANDFITLPFDFEFLLEKIIFWTD